MPVRALLRTVLLTSLTLLTVTTVCAQTSGPAFSRSADGYVLRFGVAWLTASHEYGLDGKLNPLFTDTLSFRDAKFGQTDVAFLCEYGITDWLTGVAQTQLRTVVREAYFGPSGHDTTISASGLTDLWIGARLRLLPVESRFRATATIAWKAPMGSPTQAIPLGTGVPDYSLGAAAAAPYEIGPIVGHVQLSSDFRFRNRANNEFAFLGQLDVNLGRGFIVQGTFDGVRSLADFEATSGDGAVLNQSVVGDRSFGRWSVGLLLEADKGMDLGASYSNHFVGRNALAASAFALSVTWRGPALAEDNH